MIESFIGLGSNLNDPTHQISRAIQRVSDIEKLTLMQQSSLYKSAPMGPQDQDPYVNAVIRVNTGLSPLALLGSLAAIEEEFGRDRSVGHWGPRVIDLDILLYAQQEIRLRRLIVPHPGLTEREFVVYPLLEIAPNLTLPGGARLTEVAAKTIPLTLQKL